MLCLVLFLIFSSSYGMLICYLISNGYSLITLSLNEFFLRWLLINCSISRLSFSSDNRVCSTCNVVRFGFVFCSKAGVLIGKFPFLAGTNKKGQIISPRYAAPLKKGK